MSITYRHSSMIQNFSFRRKRSFRLNNFTLQFFKCDIHVYFFSHLQITNSRSCNSFLFMWGLYNEDLPIRNKLFILYIFTNTLGPRFGTGGVLKSIFNRIIRRYEWARRPKHSGTHVGWTYRDSRYNKQINIYDTALRHWFDLRRVSASESMEPCETLGTLGGYRITILSIIFYCAHRMTVTSSKNII